MTLDAVSSLPKEPAPPRTTRRRVRLPVFQAQGGDHPTIYYFLRSILPGFSRTEYVASLEDPFYEPRDRLLLRRGWRIAAHAHLTHRTMHFGAAAIPAAGLDSLGVAAEHRGRGLGDHLLRAAEDRMEADGALVGMLHTSIPHFFRRTGWALCGQPSCRRADARALLASLSARGLIPRPKRRLHIRPLLQWERAALARVYQQNASATAFGLLERTDAYWHWLLERRACDQVYVALEGPDQLELGEVSTRVVGYAAIRGEQILELMTAPDRPRAAAELLARCCGDAIELDRHYVTLHAPPGCPWFPLFEEAFTGTARVTDRAEVAMMRLLDPLGVLRQLCGEFDRRATEARLPRPLDLGLSVDGRKYQVELQRDGIGVTSQRIGRSYLRLNVADFTRLVLGQLDWGAATADGRLECSTALARQAGRALFPAVSFWRPPWDDAPAQ